MNRLETPSARFSTGASEIFDHDFSIVERFF